MLHHRQFYKVGSRATQRKNKQGQFKNQFAKKDIMHDRGKIVVNIGLLLVSF